MRACDVAKRIRVLELSTMLLAVASTSARAVDLSVTNVEVTQALQTQTNTIQLVAQRSTAVRATLAVAQSLAPVGGVTGQLHVFVNGTEITPAGGVAPINGPFTAPLAPQRTNQNDTLNFEIAAPTGITASTDIDVRVDLTPVSGETNVNNNSGSANDLTFVDRTTPQIFFTRINYAGNTLGTPALAMVQAGVGDAFVRGILPVNDADPVLYRPGLFPTLNYGTDEDSNGMVDASGKEGNDLLSLLASCRQLIVDRGLGASDRTFLYGWLAGSVGGNGLGQTPGNNAFGNTDPVRYQRSFAHELTHNFGLNHNSNSTNQVGWDVGARLINNPSTNNTTGRLKPTTLFDIQNPGQVTNSAWIDTTNYNFLLGHATLALREAARVVLDEDNELSSNVLVIQGIFDSTGTVLEQLKPVFRYPWLSQPSLEPPPIPSFSVIPRQASGSFFVEVVDSQGNIFRFPFDPTVADDSLNEVEVSGAFEILVALDGDAREVRIYDTNGQLVGTLVRSQVPPTVQIIEPQPNGLLINPASVVWEATDRDTPANELMFQVAYSFDNGQSFVPIGVDIRGNELIFDSASIPRSRGAGLIRVFASDGLNTSFADVTGLTTNFPPDCSNAVASQSVLWPPDHKYANVSIDGVTDSDGDPVTVAVTGITQDEPLDGLGDGDTCPDAAGIGTATASLRAERAGTKKVPGDGRVYHVSFTADDGRGGRCSAAVQVCVPDNQRPGRVCVDSKPVFDSTGPCR